MNRLDSSERMMSFDSLVPQRESLNSRTMGVIETQNTALPPLMSFHADPAVMGASAQFPRFSTYSGSTVQPLFASKPAASTIPFFIPAAPYQARSYPPRLHDFSIAHPASSSAPLSSLSQRSQSLQADTLKTSAKKKSVKPKFTPTPQMIERYQDPTWVKECNDRYDAVKSETGTKKNDSYTDIVIQVGQSRNYIKHQIFCEEDNILVNQELRGIVAIMCHYNVPKNKLLSSARKYIRDFHPSTAKLKKNSLQSFVAKNQSGGLTSAPGSSVTFPAKFSMKQAIRVVEGLSEQHRAMVLYALNTMNNFDKAYSLCELSDSLNIRTEGEMALLNTTLKKLSDCGVIEYNIRYGNVFSCPLRNKTLPFIFEALKKALINMPDEIDQTYKSTYRELLMQIREMI